MWPRGEAIQIVARMVTTMRRFTLLIFSSIVTAGTLSASSLFLPTGQPEFDFIYDRLERTETFSSDRFDYQLWPYSFGSISQAGPFQSWQKSNNRTLNLFAFVSEDFGAKENKRSTSYERFRAGITGRPSDRLFFYSNFILDEQLAGDSSYSGKEWRGFAGKVENAFARIEFENFDLMLGRFASPWGIRRSFIFSSDRPLDGFSYRYRWGKLTLSYRLARLDALSPEIDSVSQIENRYYAAHRLDLHLSNKLRVGLFETVLFGGAGRQIDLYYLNPILFYHGAQLNDGSNDNTAVGFDFTYKPKVGWKIYGQLMIDDLQIDREIQGDQEPDEYALLGGIYLSDLWQGLDFQAEYSRVTNRTFNQMLLRNRYLFDNKLIGSALENDYDLTELSIKKWFSNQTLVVGNFSYYRKGEGSIHDEWTQPWTEIVGDYSEPFPTGNVKHTTTVSLQLKTFINTFGYLDCEAGSLWIGGQSQLFVNFRLSAFLLESLSIN